MDPSSYKDVETSRGINYHYYVSPAQDNKPVLLFLHGFPSTAWDWRHQVSFFESKGYGLIVPDMLGYGGTDKPTNNEAFRDVLICRDIIDIVDAEGVEKCIVIGHDWGSKVASRLANYYPERFVAFAFLALSYVPPKPEFNLAREIAETKKHFGYELYGYWYFFSEEGTGKLIEDHWDSFHSLGFANDPDIWATDFAPLGAAKAWLLDNRKAPLASYITEEEKNIQMAVLLKGGFNSPLGWYRAVVTGVNLEDEKHILPDRYTIEQPVFLGAALRDRICLAGPAKATVGRFCPNATVRDFDVGHWLTLSAADKLNQELLSWIETSVYQ